MQAGLIHAGFGRRETGRGGSLKPSEAASSAPVVKNTAAAANPRSARRCKLWAIEGCLLEISIACVNDQWSKVVWSGQVLPGLSGSAWIEVQYGSYPVYMPTPSTHASISGIRL